MLTQTSQLRLPFQILAHFANHEHQHITGQHKWGRSALMLLQS
jgi:hypothetical protein